MNVTIRTEKELVEKFRKAIHILNNMRNIQKLWEEKYGVELKTKRKAWEKQADDFLKEIGDPFICIKK